MPNTGDYYEVTLKKTHINWGQHRYTYTRERIYGETFIPIPLKIARALGIYNSNKEKRDILGVNLFEYKTYINDTVHSEGTVKAQGCNKKGAIHAKNLSGYMNLKELSPWIDNANIQVGDRIQVYFSSPTSIELRKL